MSLDYESVAHILRVVQNTRAWLLGTLNTPVAKDDQLMAIHNLQGVERILLQEKEKRDAAARAAQSE